jgi:hypothetical protein
MHGIKLIKSVRIRDKNLWHPLRWFRSTARFCLRNVFWVFAFVGYPGILATHFHYSIDVLAAVFASWALFKMFHVAVRSHKIKLRDD